MTPPCETFRRPSPSSHPLSWRPLSLEPPVSDNANPCRSRRPVPRRLLSFFLLKPLSLHRLGGCAFVRPGSVGLTLDEARSRRATHQIEQRRPEDRRCVQTSRFLGALLGSRVPMHLSLLTGGLGLRGTRKRRRTESNDKAQGEYRNYRFHDRLLRF